MLVTYDVTRHDGDRVFGTSLYTKYVTEKSHPEFPGSKIDCDLERVQVLITSDDYFSPKLYWRKDIFGAEGTISPLMDAQEGVPVDLAIIHLREGWGTWILRSELLTNERLVTDCRFGITISNAKNKPMLAGVGQLTEVEYVPLKKDLPPKRGHIFTYSFSELFPGRWASPLLCGSCSGSDRNNSPSVYPDYSAPDGGTPDAGP